MTQTVLRQKEIRRLKERINLLDELRKDPFTGHEAKVVSKLYYTNIAQVIFLESGVDRAMNALWGNGFTDGESRHLLNSIENTYRHRGII